MGNSKNQSIKRNLSYLTFGCNFSLIFLITSFCLLIHVAASTTNSSSHFSEIPSPMSMPTGRNAVKGEPKSCSDITTTKVHQSNPSKIYSIYPHDDGRRIHVLCDFITDVDVAGGANGWTLIQKRNSGPRDEFDRNWNDYKNGFGSLDENGNFWLGLENIHALTKDGDQELRIELEDFQGEKRYAKYSNFSISDESDFYQLNISGFSGDAGDSMTGSSDKKWVLNGMRFSTWDKDNDNWAVVNCAADFESGWWFNDCGPASNLNGIYRENISKETASAPSWKGITWYEWKDGGNFLAKTKMKIRKRK